MIPFSYKNGSLCCENLKIDRIIQECGVGLGKTSISEKELVYELPPTPVYVYSSAGLQINVNRYVEALNAANFQGKIGYAVKANPNSQLIEKLKAFGVEMIIAVSGFEVLSAIRAGFSPENILLNGNGKQRWEIKVAIENGVMLNVDSEFDARQIADLHAEINSENEVKVLLRIRPSAKPCNEDAQLQIHDYVNTAENSKFGFEMTEIDTVLQILSTRENIKIVGVHCHFGSGIDNPKSFQWLGQTMSSMVRKLSERGIKIEILDVGGGIGINYYAMPKGFVEGLNESSKANYEAITERKLDVDDDGHGNSDITACMKALGKFIPHGVNVIIEPGRSLVGNAGVLVCKVLGKKSSNNRSILVTDGSMTEVIRPCLYGAHHNILPITINSEQMLNWEPYDVVGPICESADFLGKKVPMQSTSEYLAVMDCGAYCSSMSMTYNLKPRPAEILVDGDSWTYIRKKDSFEELTNKFYPNGI